MQSEEKRVMTLIRPTTLAAGAALAAAVATFLAPAPVRAADLDETESVVVHFGDLDVNTPNGAHLLYMRLRNAAKTVCGNEFEAIDLKERGNILDCQRDAIQQAVEYVDRPQLTALYDRRYPQDHAIVSATTSGASRG
jgi:UrcA family protein